jgi:hypothetical protein
LQVACHSQATENSGFGKAGLRNGGVKCCVPSWALPAGLSHTRCGNRVCFSTSVVTPPSVGEACPTKGLGERRGRKTRKLAFRIRGPWMAGH